MKRINTVFIFLAISLLIAGLSASTAVSLPKLYLISYDTTKITGSIDDEMIMHGKIKNVSFLETVTVKLKINVLNIQQGQSLLICWGETCYPPVTKTGQIEFSDPYTLQTQQESGPNFKCAIEQGGVTGNIKVTFTFFDVSNPSDSATFTSQAEVIPTIAVDPEMTALSLFPMPVNDYLSVSLASNKYPYNNYSSLEIIDMTGSKVKSMSIKDGMGAFTIHTDDLSQGIYLLTLIGKDGSIETRKFVVAR